MKHKRIVSLGLGVILLANSMPWADVLADVRQRDKQVTKKINKVEETKEIGWNNLPEAIRENAVVENEHIKRLYEEEADACSILYENNDGTRTEYIFDTPVKYTDESGQVRDKSNELVSEITKEEFKQIMLM